ncbi:serine carboxypeptidase S28-domain-containing protein [Apodospora peruviana]|uniref:Serine carboxypeptidase S28-domain-containing protein n=1 Tax=Apodospora peruviana TaxID=516989 RepID=A0AAE0IRW0_9PEZI|nr:serine carboxypeptidase S28-domain-containing protein [Apodospora peruviana]
MKLAPGAVLPFASWIAPKASIHGVQDVQADPKAGISLAANKLGVSCDWFKQPVDHHDPSLGTWDQQYCVSREWWAGEGSPVVLMTPGEVPMSGAVSSGQGYTFLDNTTMVGMHAQAIGAATVVLEHRYFGSSSPYDGFDSETLQYLTLEQSAADLANFAKNIVFPFDKNQTSNSPKAPWVFFGTSYTATLGSWIEHFYPGVFYAFHLSSAMVEMNSNNWYYYDTIRKGIDVLRPATATRASCSLALEAVTEFVDGILLAKTPDPAKVDALKQFFGASFPIADDDFAYALATPFRYWQESQGYRDVLRLCDAVVADNNTMDAGILGTVPAVVKNYATYFVSKFLDTTCTYFDVWGQDDPLWCLNSHDYLNPFIEARTLGNPWRTWYWFLCNEPIASWATGAPADQPSIVSRKITSAYWQQQCEMHFPAFNGQKYGSAAGKTPDTLNKKTGGWLRNNTTRIIWTNGEFDPWRSTTMSSELRPGGPLQSTDDVPVFLIKNAQHGDDAFTELGIKNAGYKINPEVTAVQVKAVEIMKKWISGFKAPK